MAADATATLRRIGIRTPTRPTSPRRRRCRGTSAERIAATPFISLQPQYSLIARDIEADILATCTRHGLGTLVWGPLGGGILAGRYRRGAEPTADTRMGRLLASPQPAARSWADKQLSDRNLDIADAVGDIATDLAATPVAVALAWVRDRPGVTSVIIGPRSLDQLRQNLTGLELALPDDAIDRLDDISGPAPSHSPATRSDEPTPPLPPPPRQRRLGLTTERCLGDGVTRT